MPIAQHLLDITNIPICQKCNACIENHRRRSIEQIDREGRMAEDVKIVGDLSGFRYDQWELPEPYVLVSVCYSY